VCLQHSGDEQTKKCMKIILLHQNFKCEVHVHADNATPWLQMMADLAFMTAEKQVYMHLIGS